MKLARISPFVIKNRNTQKFIFYKCKILYFCIFILFPICINLIYAIANHSWSSQSTLLFTKAITSDINKEQQSQLFLSIILAVAQISTLIYLLYKTPIFFIHSGGIILAFFSILNFFAIGFVSGLVLDIIKSVNKSDFSTSTQTLVGATLQVASYVFLFIYIFLFCRQLRGNILKPFFVSSKRKSVCKRKVTNSINMSKTSVKGKSSKTSVKGKSIGHQTLLSDSINHKHNLQKQGTGNQSNNWTPSNMKFSWFQSAQTVGSFIIGIVVLFFIFKWTSGGIVQDGSNTNNQNALNQLFTAHLFGRILFILLVAVLAPIIEECATRNGIISVLNFKQVGTSNFEPPDLKDLKKTHRLFIIIGTVIFSTYFFANMHVLFAPYSQITDYLLISSVLSITYVSCNFVVGNTILIHSAYNTAALAYSLQT